MLNLRKFEKNKINRKKVKGKKKYNKPEVNKLEDMLIIEKIKIRHMFFKFSFLALQEINLLQDWATNRTQRQY